MRRLGPQLAGAQKAAYVAPELQRRVQQLCAAMTLDRAAELLKVGRESLIAARDGGRLRPDTIGRIMEGLELAASRMAG